jgi:tetratricopeptide (TPR) repeat protein
VKSILPALAAAGLLSAALLPAARAQEALPEDGQDRPVPDFSAFEPFAPDPDLAPAPGSGEPDAPALPGAQPGPEIPGWAQVRDRVGARAQNLGQRAMAQLPAPARQGLRDLRQLTFSDEARETLVIALSGLLALLVLARLLRGSGDVAVTLEYPSELRGTFTVRIRRRPWSARRRARVSSPSAAERARRRARAASRTVHPMVARETRFPNLAARQYIVEVDGFLQTGGQDDVVTSHHEDRQVRVRRGRTVRIEFDLHPHQCPVEVRVTWDQRPASEALMALRNTPGSLRYARGGSARMGVPMGSHTLLVGSGDRVAEKTIEIQSFQPTAVGIDLADREVLLFTGCPPAVEPYLQGDVPAAARALERDGQHEVSHLLLAHFEQDHGRLDNAADHFEHADRLTEAARLREALQDYERSAVLWDRAGDAERAAEMFRSAGDLVKAGEAFQRARQFESAVECFREAADVARWVEALERHGAPFRAAQVAIEHEDWGRAIRCLEQVSAHDPHYAEAAEMLVDAYQQQGHLDLAVRKIEELVARKGRDHAPLPLCDKLAGLLEESGDYDRALDVLELIRCRDATWPSLATRIEELRKRRSRERSADSGARTDPTHFSGEFRYEILEEVGRGGMGIVFKARDRRLGRVVALKRLPDNLRNHPKAVELFLREARAAAALNHPNIVTLFDADQEGETYYITMELLEGHPLQKILKTRGRFGARDAARLVTQVANGLQYAHDKGIVHRDIKTGNLFFTYGKVVKIMDFGLAKMVEEVRRATTVIGGTPYYMAPEQSQGGPVDHRVDIYALGVTLYEFLTGKVPFDDGDVAYHHRHTPPPDPREKVPELPAELAELVLHMLAKSPDDRCGSARRVAERLQAIAKTL